MNEDCDNPQNPFVRPDVVPAVEPCSPESPARPDSPVRPDPATAPSTTFARPVIVVASGPATADCSTLPNTPEGGSIETEPGARFESVDVADAVPSASSAQLQWLLDRPSVRTALGNSTSQVTTRGLLPAFLPEQADRLHTAIAAARVIATESARTGALAALRCVWKNDAQIAECGGGSVTPPVTVAAGTVESPNDKAEANAIALAQAEALLSCEWKNSSQTATCVDDLGFATAVPTDAPDVTPRRIGSVTVAAGAVTSNTNQADADAQARAQAVAALRCFYVNEAGNVACTNGAPSRPPAPGQMLVPGNPVYFPARLVTSLSSPADALADAQNIALSFLICEWRSNAYACPSVNYNSQSYSAQSGSKVVLSAGAVVSIISEADMLQQLADTVAALNLCTYCNKERAAKCGIADSGSYSIDRTQSVDAGKFCAQTPELAERQADAINSIPLRQLEAGANGSNVGCRFSSKEVQASCNAPTGSLPPGSTAVRVGPLPGGFYHTTPVSSLSTPSVIVTAGAVTAETQAAADQGALAQALALLNCVFANVRVEALCGDTLAQYADKLSQYAASPALTGTGAGMLDGVAVVSDQSFGHPCEPVVVLAGTYTSTVSQTDANRFAVTSALSQLDCFYYNSEPEVDSTCGSDPRGIPMILVRAGTVMPGQVRSQTSQADANSQAQSLAESLTVCISEDLVGSGAPGSPGERGAPGNCSTSCAAVYS